MERRWAGDLAFLAERFGRKDAIVEGKKRGHSMEGLAQGRVLVFDRLPTIEPGEMAVAIAAVEAVGTIRVRELTQGNGLLHAIVSFADHDLRIVGFEQPLAHAAFQRAIDCSPWEPADKRLLERHRAHVLCYAIGKNTDATEDMIATLKLAAAWSGRGLLGVVDPDAWAALPEARVSELLAPAFLSAVRSAVPLGLWTGFARRPIDDGTAWYLTRGHHRWNVPDFVMHAREDVGDQVFERFTRLFRHAQATGLSLAAEGVIALGAERYRVSVAPAIPPLAEAGPVTLMVELLSGNPA